MREITLRIVGTACFVNGGDDHPEFKKRLVLPADFSYPTPDDRHIAYVEFPDAGIVDGSNLSAVYQHPTHKGQVDYRRFEMSGHVVTIQSVGSDPFVVRQSFDERVPKMTRIAASLDPAPRKECFANEPDPSIIAAILDISHGLLKAGELFEDTTKWKLRSGMEVYRLRTAKSTELLLSVVPPLTISFTKDGKRIDIVLNETVDVITIGNQPLGDIVGEGSGEDVEHHFKLYYQLAYPPNVPGDPPVPGKFLLTTNACTQTTWP